MAKEICALEIPVGCRNDLFASPPFDVRASKLRRSLSAADAPTLGQRQPIELNPSMALVTAVFEMALEDPAYSLREPAEQCLEAEEVTAHRAKKGARGEAAYTGMLPASGQIAGISELWFRDQSAGVLEAGYWERSPTAPVA